MTTPTPRTDELIKKHSIGHTNGSLHYLMEELARQLERDLAAALERINKSEADIAAMTTYAKTQQDRALAAEARAEALREQLAAALSELERVRDKCNEHYMALAAAQEEAAKMRDEREGNMRQFRRLQERLAQAEADEKFWKEVSAEQRAELLKIAENPFEGNEAALDYSCTHWKERAQAAEALAESNARDAERYRWMRVQPHADIAACWYMPVLPQDYPVDTPEQRDAAIDAAIAEGK